MPVKSVYLKLWDTKRLAYPFHLETPTARNAWLVADDLGFSSFVSFASAAGGRVWGFETEEDRAKFVAAFGGNIVQL